MARGGMPGGFDMNALMKQAQQMQSEMLQAQEQLKDEIVEASAGGGMVKVKMGGDLTLREIIDRPRRDRPRGGRAARRDGPGGGQRGAALGPGARQLEDGRHHGRARGRPPRNVSTEGPAPLARLVAELARLPGIGQRTAQRLAFHILRAPDEEAAALATAIAEVKEKVGLCTRCFNLAEGPLCRICSDSGRDQSTICVVEEPADVIPIERTHEYRGLYHVLGGALSPIDGVDAEDLKIAELVRRVEEGEVSEVVLATNPTTTGEATALHIAALLRDSVTVTRLASGLPVGADLEHADEVTLGKALAGRRELSS